MTTSDIPTIELNEEVETELARYGLTTADLRDFLNEVKNEEQEEPDESRLVVADGAVSRADETAIGRVRVNNGKSRAVYACKLSLDTTPSCIPASLQTRRVFLLGKPSRQEFDPPRVISMVSRSPFQRHVEPHRPLAAIVKTSTGIEHPLDAEVLRAVELLLRKS